MKPTVGDTNPIILFQAPDDTDVFRLVGFFDSTEPDEPLANFDLIVGPINFTSGQGVPEWTYYLPAMTGMTTFQVTDVGSSVALGDNTNYFLSEAALSVVPDRPAGTPGVDFLIIDNGINEWFVNIKPASLVGETVADEPFSPGGTPWDVPIGTQRTSVPEPTSTLSLLALGTLGAASTLKRKLKSSKSTEKETTKVS
jgi:hypothetical protein